MRSFFILYTARIGLLGIAFLADVIITRELGPALRGEYFLFVTVVTQISLVATLGLEYSFPNMAREGLLKSYFSEIMDIRLIQSFIVILVLSMAIFLVFLDKFTSVESKPLFLTIIVIVCLLEVLFVWATFYKLALGEISSSFTIRYIRRTAFLAIIAVMAYINFFSLAVAISAYIISLLIIIYYVRQIALESPDRKEYDVRPLKLSLVIIRVLEFFMIRGNVYLVSYWLLAEDIGYLSIAMAVLELMLFLPNALTSALFSKMIHSDEVYLHIRKRLLILVAILLLIQSIIVYFFAETFIRFVYGEGFLPSTSLIQAYSVIIIVIAPVTVIVTNTLRYNNINHILYPLLTGSFALLTIGSWLTIQEGVIGGIAAQFIACLVFMALYFCYGRLWGEKVV